MKKLVIIFLSIFILSTKFAFSDGHQMDQATCFQEYNPEILNYIKSRI